MNSAGPADGAQPGGAEPHAGGAVRVAGVQFAPRFGQTEHNRRRLSELVRQAAAGGAQLVVLPELATAGYASADLSCGWRLAGRPPGRLARTSADPLRVAETAPGPTTDHFAKLARALGVYLTIPLLERGPDGPQGPALYNTVCLAGPTGELLAHYRKLNLWPYAEPAWATPGDRGLAVAETSLGRLGIAICYDIHTLLPRYAKERLWALLFPSAWVDHEHPADFFWHRLPAQARACGFHIVGANWSAPGPQRWRGYGFTTQIDRNGLPAAAARTLYGDELVFADLPL